MIIIHIIPIGDEKIHCAQMSCDCKPKHKDGIAVHNSYDCREIPENITGESCSEGWIVIGQR